MIHQPHTLTLAPPQHPTHTIGALALRPRLRPSYRGISFLPWKLADLSQVERYVFRCATTNAWAHRDTIRYKPGTEHQLDAAFRLADLHLLRYWPGYRPGFSLTLLGDLAARRFFHSAPAQRVYERELEYDVLRALMHNGWLDQCAIDKVIAQAIEAHCPQAIRL